jgi:cysteine-rich repeat protein
MLRSLDGGSSWNAINTGLTYTNVFALAINPATPSTLYAGTGGVFQSLNGGSSWQATALTDSIAVALAINPATPTTLYAGTDGGDVFQSTNGGSSWTGVSTGLPDYPLSVYAEVSALAINPTTPTTLYAGTLAGVCRSLDAGSSWQATGLGGVICGDGFAACGEECDDGGESATCDADCTLAQCGDGTLNVTTGEHCDDGNHNPFDSCTNDCTVCGDGVVTPWNATTAIRRAMTPAMRSADSPASSARARRRAARRRHLRRGSPNGRCASTAGPSRSPSP